jgi:hypothetical protein
MTGRSLCNPSAAAQSLRINFSGAATTILRLVDVFLSRACRNARRAPGGRGVDQNEMQRVFVLKIMTHKQYDTEDWKNECHCY